MSNSKQLSSDNPSALLAFLAWFGAPACAFTTTCGGLFLFTLEAFRRIWARHMLRRVMRQVYVIGAKSFLLIALIGLFTGMVLGLQGYYSLVKFGADGFLGAAVALTLIRELGPVLTAIMVTGRAGSSMAAEIGVMRISDQVDALDVMDINSMSYLVSPRLVASLIVFPLLTAIFDIIGIIGGYITGVIMLGMNSGVYISRVESSVEMLDVRGGFIKAAAFAILVSMACSYMGYFVHKRRDSAGPEAVSNATTAAVVLSCVLILMFDYVLTSFLL